MKLKIFNDEFNDFGEGLEKNLCLLTEYILTDHSKDKLSINLKFVTSSEMKRLNKSFRNKNFDTNVLSFPTSTDVQRISGELGDIAMSIPYIKTESQNLNRDLDDHMMHLLAHGILHLLGFDHNKDKNAGMMEAQETKYLNSFKIANPYEI